MLLPILIITMAVTVTIFKGNFFDILPYSKGDGVFNIAMGILVLLSLSFVVPVVIILNIIEELKLLKDGKEVIEIDELGIKYRNALTDNYGFIDWRNIDGVNYKNSTRHSGPEVIIYVSESFLGKYIYEDVRTNDGVYRMRSVIIKMDNCPFKTIKTYRTILKNMEELGCLLE